MSRQEFHKRARKVVDWFTPLNPYKKHGSILKIEDLNYESGSDKMAPLYCFAISAKRYAMFNLTRDNRPVLRKASAHGLGHLLDPYPECRHTGHLIARRSTQRDWRQTMAIRLLVQDHSSSAPGATGQRASQLASRLQRPAAIRYTASSPHLLNWVARWNDGRPYEEQIRPFGFLLSFMPRTGVFAPSVATPLDQLKRGRPPTTETLAPIAPYDSDPANALSKVFDRVTGKPIQPEQLKTYAEVLAQYHLSCEDKSRTGSFGTEVGRSDDTLSRLGLSGLARRLTR